MNRIPFITLLAFQLFFTAQIQFAQARPPEGQGFVEVRKELKLLALTEGEIASLEKVVQKDEAEVEKVQAELKVLQAKLERLMLEKNPPMDEIKALLKESMEWEYKIRLIRLERNIAIRAIVGQDRWARVYKLSKAWLLLRRAGKNPDNMDIRLLKILEALQ